MQQSIIIDTRAAVIICPDPDKAAEYIRDLLDLGMQRSEGLRFSIETKPTDQVERFLSGGALWLRSLLKKSLFQR
jgi:hypothetical protein